VRPQGVPASSPRSVTRFAFAGFRSCPKSSSSRSTGTSACHRDRRVRRRHLDTLVSSIAPWLVTLPGIGSIPPEAVPIVEPFLAGLGIAYAFDLPYGYELLGPRHCTEVGVPPGSLRVQAMVNLPRPG
jgi:hypothetical protein